ncbi:MAG: 16S rRNA (guanine(966)-N(2))-methyltransferase RsmD [Microthrixaceae bacterium]
MRVVGGSWRGRRLVAPPGTTTRPTSDRVRESVFNMLESLGLVAGARVADLFCGSGALGIEALSRGAVHATFVDRDRAAIEATVENLRRCGIEPSGSPRRSAGAGSGVPVDGTGAAASASVRRVDLSRRDADPGFVDLVLADPPYSFGNWSGVLRAVSDAGVGALVVESDRAVVLGSGWNVLRERSYGGTVVQIALARQPETLTRLAEPPHVHHSAGPS